MASGDADEPAVMAFLQEWLIGHTLGEDRRLGSFLNGKGVY